MLEQTLYFPRCYEYRSKNFKSHNEKEKQLAEKRLKDAKERYKDRISALNEFKQTQYNPKSKDDAVTLTKKKREMEDADSNVKKLEYKLELIKKNFNKPKVSGFVLNFTFFNFINRMSDK